ncbi:hypothetical protein PC113_g24021 [Phytophthora cactorum]|uniref:Uncharacterized protein n=1 Tax=Phytophthora cactorum TaxID=29920 RepID=A0A8T0XXP7_9STRA|nr:hypothetical protein PC113_g24021 [Phytophthora cactorum]KAG3130663.1 hypothetical protein PC128_g26698 [Phytophthora cactorum]
MCEACAEDTKDCMLGYIGGGGQLQLTLQVLGCSRSPLLLLSCTAHTKSEKQPAPELRGPVVVLCPALPCSYVFPTLRLTTLQVNAPWRQLFVDGRSQSPVTNPS